MITREEAIKRLEEARFTIQPYFYMNEAIDMAIEALRQERPNGGWKSYEIDVNECSECGYLSIFKYNFCPVCGADMRGEE